MQIDPIGIPQVPMTHVVVRNGALSRFTIQDFGDLHTTHKSQQQRDVVDPFLFHDNRLCLHHLGLAISPFLVYPYTNDGLNHATFVFRVRCHRLDQRQFSARSTK